jgi:hypothetical protein
MDLYETTVNAVLVNWLYPEALESLYRSLDKYVNVGLQLLSCQVHPLMKNRNRSLLDLIKEHYFCMFIYYHCWWIC